MAVIPIPQLELNSKQKKNIRNICQRREGIKRDIESLRSYPHPTL